MKKGLNVKRRGQMQLSFGMIFSIILIIVFIAFAFYAIKKFLDFQEYSQIISFKEDLQNDIDSMWQSTQGSRPASYTLPRAIEQVCFKADSRIFFEPLGSGQGIDPFSVEHIDIDKVILRAGGRSYCIENKKGKIKMTIKKDFGDSLVDIEGG